MTVLILLLIAVASSVCCLVLVAVGARHARKSRRMVDPIGWDATAQRMHDVELQPTGRLLHFSTCWCRTAPQPARPSPVVGSRNG